MDVSVILLAAGATWESEALRLLQSARGVTVIKRCVDLPDLLASATTGEAEVALVSGDAQGLDAPALAHLRRFGLRGVVVADHDHDRLRRMGAAAVIGGDLAGLRHTVDQVVSEAPEPVADALPAASEGAPGAGRVVAVWGPGGAPGRTTLTVGLAAELAARDRGVLAVDADPYGGCMAQHLGILDEVSGLLATARLANSGELEAAGLRRASRDVGGGLCVLTGLPRPDRWTEVRAGTLSHVLALARDLVAADAAGDGLVVVDTGFSLEQGIAEGALGRNQMTVEALESADEVVVVGAADPVGLARLARGLVELRGLVAGTPVRVVVNRMRGSLGWSEHEITGMVEGFARPVGVHFVLEDRAGADRALMAGRTVTEVGESALRRGIAAVADGMLGRAASPRRSRVRRRTS